MDNTMVLKYVNHQGGTRIPLLQDLALDISNELTSWNLILQATHILGVTNVEADQLSQMVPAYHEMELPKPTPGDQSGPMESPDPGSGDSFLEDSIVVSMPTPHGGGTSHSSQDLGIVVDRMEDIQTILLHQDIPEEVTMANLYHGLHRNTNKAYYYAWQKFAHWCFLKQIDHLQLNVITLLTYLSEMAKMNSIHSVKLHKAAIVSTWETGYPDSKISKHWHLHLFIRSLERKTTPKKKPPVWQVEQLLQFLCQLLDNQDLSWHRFSQKVHALLCLTTMWCPRSDFARVTLNGVEFHHEDGKLDVLTLTAYHVKESNHKSVHVQALEHNLHLCPVHNTQKYINKPQEFRQPQEQVLFITK
ncbi:hypothetical protein IWQ61_004164 [Dispira simplex]|nr:hypothetical protein IWQ61_004164 [Dispira simplex]